MRVFRFKSVLLLAALCTTCAAAVPSRVEPAPQPVLAGAHDRLQHALEAIAQRARPGTLGIAVVDMQSGAAWLINGDRAYPMMSVFKAPLAAAVLDRVDKGQLTLNQRVAISREQLRHGQSAIRDAFRGESMSFPVGELLRDSVSDSDNTAADALMRLIGGPGTVTVFLRSHGIAGMRVDMNEGQVSDLFLQLGAASAPPADETPWQRDQRLARGLQAYLADPRNRSTPSAATDFLRKLAAGTLLSPASTQRLLGLMRAQTNPRRLRAGLPRGVTLADKCGTSVVVHGVSAAFNDIGIMTWPDGRRVIVAAFLTASRANHTERDRLFADIAQAIDEAAIGR